MSRKTAVIVIAFLLALSAGSFAQETKTPDSNAQVTKKKKKAATTKVAAKTQATAKDAAKDQGTSKDTGKDQGTAKGAAKDQGATKSTAKGAAKEQGAAKKVPKDIVILKAPNGGVKFLHTAHSKDRAIKCETCHHPSRTEKPATAAQQACSDCHTTSAKPPMKTKLQAAFHNPTATAGVCINCHKAEDAKGKKAPTKCTECHKKENA